MDQVFYVISTALSFFIDIILVCMFLTAVMSFLAVDEENPIFNVLGGISEFFVYPIRYICEQMDWFQSIPIDMPFFITMVVFSIVNTLLQM